LNDYEKVKQLFSELNIGWLTEVPDRIPVNDNNKRLILYSGKEKIDGYCDFFSEFEFDSDGKFIKVGIWE
jgi:hypothetical protein